MFGWAVPSTSPMLQARLDIESDIDVHIRAISDLRTRLNTLTPIGSLPPELLSGILVHRAIDDYRSVPNIHNTHLSWIRLSHISRHFRAVTLSTPQFWSYLRLMKGRVFAELLARSMSAPLHITASTFAMSGYPDRDRALVLEMLLPHSRRIKELYIDGPSKLLQSFCTKTISPFDTLDKLELTSPPTAHDYHPSESESRLPDVVPILASSTSPPRLRHLELRWFPFCWNDPIFSSPTLTTLVIVGYDRNNYLRIWLPDVGSFDALFSSLASIAHRLEVLEIQDAIPTQGLTVADPVQLPLPSETILLSSIKRIHLVGDAIYVTHLLNHISFPSTASLNVIARNPLGNKKLAQSVAAHMSDRPPFLSLHLDGSRGCPLILSGWTHFGTSGDAPLKVTFSSSESPEGDLFSIIRGSGALSTCAQELRISKMFMPTDWANVFTCFPSMRTLVFDEHPSEDMLCALMTVNRLEYGNISGSVVAPSLRVLRLSNFWFNMEDEPPGEAFDGLLDLAIFRCNYGIPIDEIHLINCRNATKEQMERLKEVVVDVEWTGCLIQWTARYNNSDDSEDDDSDEDLGHSNSDSDYRYGSYDSDDEQ